MTSTNLERPWLLFEAGALAKQFDVARVVPLLIDLKPADVIMPLASFQGRELSEDGMRRLVRDLNLVRKQPLPPQQIDALFVSMWPTLEERVAAARTALPSKGDGKAFRRAEDMLAELIETVRRVDRRMDTTGIGGHPIEKPDLLRFSEGLFDLLAQVEAVDGAIRLGAPYSRDCAPFQSQIKQLARFGREIGFPFNDLKYHETLETFCSHYGISPDEVESSRP